jgi:hypothetical protein
MVTYMAKGISFIILFLSIFMLSISGVSAETGTYDATFTAPLCDSGDYTSGTPCTSGSLLNLAGSYESNHPNSVDECDDDLNSNQFYINQIQAYDTDGDGILENGDTVAWSFTGGCIDGDAISYLVAYSMNPDDLDSTTWTNDEFFSDDGKDKCDGNTFSSSGTFTITGDPDYVAIRVSEVAERYRVIGDAPNSCWSGLSGDGDDLVLQLSVPATPPTISNAENISVTQTSAYMEASFVFNDATWIDSYWKIDTVEQTHTNSTVATTNNANFTGLDKETEYDFQFCIVSDVSSETCSSIIPVTTLDRTPPYINIAGAFDIGITTASIGGTFFFEDFTNITAYAKLDGVNQTQTLYASGVSQYDKEDFTGLEPVTTYTWDWCISYENGEICEGGGNFTTSDYTIPYVNAISTFNTTNHQSEIGATVFYGSYENLTLEYYLDGSRTSEDSYDYSGSPSLYYTDLWSYLDFETTYDYRLDITYIDPRGVGSTDSTWSDGYRCTGSPLYLAHSDGRTPSEGGFTALNDVRVTETSECADLCNRFVADSSLNDGSIIGVVPEGEGCCYYVNTAPYDECIITNGELVENDPYTPNYQSQIMNATGVAIDVRITGDTYNFTTDDAEIPYISISGSQDIRGTTASIKGTVFPHDYYVVQPWWEFDGDIYNGTLINRTPEYNETLYSQSVTPTYDLTGLSMNTTYNFTFCVDYDWNGTAYQERVCDIERSLTTTVEPTFTWLSVDKTMADSLEWDWKFDYNGVHTVEYQWNGTGTWLVAPDGGTKTYGFTGLEAETNYTAFVGYRYKVELGDDFIYANSTTNTARTYYENAFDDVWDTLLQGSGTAKTILGFVVLFGIIFIGVGIFGKYNMRMGLMPIMMFVVVGTAIATLMKLFSVFILLLVIVGAVILAMITGMFKNHDEGGR